MRGSAHSLSLSELPLVLGLLLADPSELMLAAVAGPAVVLVVTRQDPVRLVFNLAQFALTARGGEHHAARAAAGAAGDRAGGVARGLRGGDPCVA